MMKIDLMIQVLNYKSYDEDDDYSDSDESYNEDNDDNDSDYEDDANNDSNDEDSNTSETTNPSISSIVLPLILSWKKK